MGMDDQNQDGLAIEMEVMSILMRGTAFTARVSSIPRDGMGCARIFVAKAKVLEICCPFEYL